MKRREKRKKRGEGEKRGKEEKEGRGTRKVVLSRDQIIHECPVALVKYRVWASSLEKLGHNYKAYLGMLIRVLREVVLHHRYVQNVIFYNFGVDKICQFWQPAIE